MPKWSRQLIPALFLAVLAAVTAHASETTTYSYDPLGRLSGASSTAGPQVSTGYDPAGNRTNYDVTGAAPPVTFSVNSASATEGGSITFTVTKSGTAAGSLNVSYATANGSAVAGSDYNAASGTLTFLASDTVKTVSVVTTDDSQVESAESFSFTLSNPSSGAVLGAATGTGTINDNDTTPPSFAVSNAAQVTEGGTLVFTVTKTGATSSSFSVNYASANGTAAAGSDYTAVSGSLTFAAAETSKTVSVTTADDASVESSETVLLNISGPTGGATITTSQGSGTIADNDTEPPSFAISGASAVTEGGNLVFTVTKTGTTSSSFSVNYATANGSAAAGSDYTSTSGTLTFGAAETSKTISVATTDDSAVESAETVLVNLSGPTGGATITTSQGSGTINDNDATLAINNAGGVNEGGSLVFTVTRSGSTAFTASVNYATADSTATAGADYTAVSGTLNFAVGEVSKTIFVSTINDTLVELNNETLLMNLSGAVGATITAAQGSGSIVDNDASFAISNAATVTEGGTLVYTVTKTGTTASGFNVSYASANGTAASGSDYVAVSGTLVFAVGEMSKTISVGTIDDAAVESAETVLVNLSNPTGGGTITTSQGSGTINDNDLPPPSFAVSTAGTVTEGGTLVFTVTKTGAASASFSVNFATADSSAVAGSDYSATSGTLTFAPAETSKTVSVATIDDGSVESSEVMLLNISGATGGATITTSQASGTISDNDTYPPPSFAISTAAAVTEGGTLVYTVTKTSPVSFAYSVNYSTADGSAAAGSDYNGTSGTLTFAVGETSKTISVGTIDDGSVESAETVLVNLSGPTGGATISASQGSGTINDNDVYPPPSFSISGAAAVAEGGVLVYTVTKTSPVSFAYSVDYATANGSAAAGSDYNGTSGTLSFAVGETSKTISVATIDDGTYEPAETVLVNLSNASGGATIAGSQGSGTINDNDVPPNNPPTPVNNSGSQPRCTVRTYNVVANDTDPDGDYPLSLVSVSGSTGGIWTVIDSQTIQFESFGTTGTRVGTYTVQDSRGATAQATLTISVTSGTCF